MPRPDHTCPYQAEAVQAKRTDCGTSNGSATDEAGKGGTPSKVVMPVVRTWIEERHHATGAQVKRFSMGSLVVVAPETAKTKVVEIVCATA
jgi:hypothetical protein